VARRIERPKRSAPQPPTGDAPPAAGGMPPIPSRRLVLLARPGAGKSTQARLLAERLDLLHIDTGARLRHEVESGSAIGRAIRSALGHGALAPDELVLDLVRPGQEQAADRGYLLDGFPRNLSQAKALAAVGPVGLRPQAAILLEVSPEECRRRLLARAALEHRVDDTAETISTRLEDYERETAPVVDWSEDLGS
jgi:adenylate kinase